MPEKMRTRRTNLATAAWGPRARRSGVPRRVGGDSTPRAPERRPAYPAFRGAYRAGPRTPARLPSYAHLCAFYAWPGPNVDVRSFAAAPRRVAPCPCPPPRTPTGTAPTIRPCGPSITPPSAHRVSPVDSPTLRPGRIPPSAPALPASRDKAAEPVRPAEIVPLGVAT